MPTYIFLSTLTDEGAKTITSNPQRIKDVNKEVEGMGVQVRYQYAVLGPFDFVTIVESPDNETVARVSAMLASRGSIKVQTLSAIPIDEFIAGIRR
ncbi:MAG: GYD domain-containing protein [Chloroflexota bacterium]